MDGVDATFQSIRLLEKVSEMVAFGRLKFSEDNKFPGCQSFLKRHDILLFPERAVCSALRPPGRTFSGKKEGGFRRQAFQQVQGREWIERLSTMSHRSAREPRASPGLWRGSRDVHFAYLFL
jgi:hypothetical protein